MTTTGLLQRAALPLIFAVSLVVVSTYYVQSHFGLASIANSTDGDLLEAIRLAGPSARTSGRADVGALAADPLDQGYVNSVIAARARESGNIKRALQEAGLLRKLGWRETRALQNLLWHATLTGNAPLLMDTLEALLRRQKLLESVYPLLDLMTANQSVRPVLVERLSANPPWRYYYLLSASGLTRADEIEGRYLVMRAVQRRGDRLQRNEIAPILPKLTSIGRTKEAFDLWRNHNISIERPLDDPFFAAAAKPVTSDSLPVLFEWQLANGNGFFADANFDERGSYLSLDWNGRGVPVFASQITSGQAGRYEALVESDLPASELSNKIGFRLICPKTAVIRLEPVRPANGMKVRLTSSTAVACDFPSLEVFGLVQPASYSGSITLRSIKLQKVRG